MSIPLDRLYYYLESLSSSNIIIYRWFPHGSKKLEDLLVIDPLRIPKNQFDTMITPCMICHDQEPLDYNYYTHEDLLLSARETANLRKHQMPQVPWCYSEDFLKLYAKSHLRVKLHESANLNDYVLLCHSEQNSDQLKLYEQNGFIGVYYWAHALIAKDWFRYAEHDHLLEKNFNKITTDFLVYNRAWSGTREYRLKFAEMLVNKNLVSVCNIKFSEFDNKLHYTEHKFKNPSLSITSSTLENCFPLNTTLSSASADYSNLDYTTSGVEVVLETLFDDVRHHLTEKALRPIACGRPFILVSTPGILNYLRMYGFKTFNGLIDESYDLILDPLQRLDAITNEMKRISSLPTDQKISLFEQIYKISDYNKQYFFSDEFHNVVINEFTSNLNSGLEICRNHMSGKWWKLFSRYEGFEWETPKSDFYRQLDAWLADHGTPDY